MKKFLSLFFALNLVLLSWAMPMYTSYLPDVSGEYVYYKDNTFTRESYIGILYYNDSALQLRYFAPRDEQQKLPEKEVAIAVSINPESKNMELMGEKLLTTVIPGTDNVDIVNYLHDILYDFTTNRSLVINLNERDIILQQELIGFGGRVNITYDCTIPIFNIKDIKDTNGKLLLHCITTGKLENGNDLSFNNFKGFPKTETNKGKKYKTGKSVEYTFDGKKISLDENWGQIAENFWLLGNDAALTIINHPKKGDDNLIELAFIKQYIQSSSNNYKDLDTLIIDKDKKGNLEISVEIYNPEKKAQVFKGILSKNKEGTSYYVLSMPIFKEPYITNKKYFDKILDSYGN